MAAIKLKRAGLGHFVVYEKSNGISGTWHHHNYPGLCCDIPSHVYSYSFALNPDWSKLYAEHWEIKKYFEKVVEDFEITPHIKLNTGVERATYDEDHDKWTVRLENGREEIFDFVINGLGINRFPAPIPDIPGQDNFGGESWHSSHWRHDVDLKGKRIAVIGAAASAVQVVPEMAKIAGHLDVFMRSANWVVPRVNLPYSDEQKKRFRRWPLLNRLHRRELYRRSLPLYKASHGDPQALADIKAYATAHLHAQIQDPKLRELLTPDYDPGCRRMLVSDDFYPSLLLPNVDLVVDRIDHIAAEGIVTGDGSLRKADAIIYCTGYGMPNFAGPVPIIGRDSVSIQDAMGPAPEVFRAVAMPGFPNYFTINSANGPLGHTSAIMPAEIQTSYIIRTIKRAVKTKAKRIEVRRDVTQKYNEEIQQQLVGTTWAGNCRSWYHDENGRVALFYPRTPFDMWRGFLKSGLHDYHIG